MPTREWSPLTTGYQVNLGDSSARSAAVRGIGHHHTATTSKAGALANFLPGGRTVTPNYFIAGREIIGIVPESRRAFTSSSSQYDGQSITYEILNNSGDPTWGFAAETLDTVMRLDAEISNFYGVPFVHALPGYWEHKNVYQWSNGAQGYATACAGPSFRINEVIIGAKARSGAGTPPPPPATKGGGTNMYTIRTVDGTVYLVTDNGWEQIKSVPDLQLIQRMFKSYPGFDTFNAAERDVLLSYISLSQDFSDARYAALQESVAKITVNVDSPAIAATVASVVTAHLAEHGVEIDAAALAEAVDEHLADDFAALAETVTVKHAAKLLD